jgi:hypothetical protein
MTKKQILGVVLIAIAFITVPYQVDYVYENDIKNGLWLQVCLNSSFSWAVLWWLVLKK